MKSKFEVLRKKILLNAVVSSIFLVSKLKYKTAMSLLDKLTAVAERLK
jgi:hypothetical protein